MSQEQTKTKQVRHLIINFALVELSHVLVKCISQSFLQTSEIVEFDNI